MYWKLAKVEPVAAEREDVAAHGRFVLHRHRDAEGAHLDLRIEQEGCLMGWRVEGTALEVEAWASEKAPHPVRWLDQDGDAERVDAGTYRWEACEAGVKALVLEGRGQTQRLEFEQVEGLPVSAVRALRAVMAAHEVDAAALGALASDGVAARQRAVARFCGLGRELEGDAFDEMLWRQTLSGLSLRGIHQHLEGMEVRFDQKYPPRPVSVASGLEEDAGGSEKAMAILKA